MTAAELIAKLAEMPPDAPVWLSVDDDEGGTWVRQLNDVWLSSSGWRAGVRLDNVRAGVAVILDEYKKFNQIPTMRCGTTLGRLHSRRQ